MTVIERPTPDDRRVMGGLLDAVWWIGAVECLLWIADYAKSMAETTLSHVEKEHPEDLETQAQCIASLGLAVDIQALVTKYRGRCGKLYNRPKDGRWPKDRARMDPSS